MDIAPRRRNSLAGYLHSHFAKDRSKSSVRVYHKAVTRLCLFMGHDVAISEVNDALLDRFVATMVRDGYSQESIRKQRCYIRGIVRHARPGGCMKLPGKRPHERNRVGSDGSEFDSDGSLLQFFRTCYEPERLVGCCPETALQHRIAIVRLCRQHGRSILVTELTDALVAGHLAWLLAEQYSRATCNNARCYLLANWRLAVRMGFLERLPTVEKLRECKRLPTAWSLAEVERILAACAATPGMIGLVPAADFWTALVLVAYDTGLRHGAILAIEHDDLDLETGWLTVPAENQKERNEQRFQLSDQAADALRPLLAIPGRLVFFWPLNSRTIWVHYRSILTRAGLPHGPRDSFHKLRRTTASHIAAAAGVEAAARQLGHSSTAITLARYIDPRIARREVDGVGFLPRPNGRAAG